MWTRCGKPAAWRAVCVRLRAILEKPFFGASLIYYGESFAGFPALGRLAKNRVKNKSICHIDRLAVVCYLQITLASEHAKQKTK